MYIGSTRNFCWR